MTKSHESCYDNLYDNSDLNHIDYTWVACGLCSTPLLLLPSNFSFPIYEGKITKPEDPKGIRLLVCEVCYLLNIKEI
jgi:hypothetical protein